MNVTFKLMNGFSKFKNPKKTEIFRQGLKNLRGRVALPPAPGEQKSRYHCYLAATPQNLARCFIKKINAFS